MARWTLIAFGESVSSIDMVRSVRAPTPRVG